jgi:hypothetical protein
MKENSILSIGPKDVYWNIVKHVTIEDGRVFKL